MVFCLGEIRSRLTHSTYGGTFLRGVLMRKTSIPFSNSVPLISIQPVPLVLNFEPKGGKMRLAQEIYQGTKKKSISAFWQLVLLGAIVIMFVALSGIPLVGWAVTQLTRK